MHNDVRNIMTKFLIKFPFLRNNAFIYCEINTSSVSFRDLKIKLTNLDDYVDDFESRLRISLREAIRMECQNMAKLAGQCIF